MGSEASRYFAEKGMDIVGIDNDMRRQFFGETASTRWQQHRLEKTLGQRYRHFDADIRDSETIDKLFRQYGGEIALVVHTAAQPSHDWAANAPVIDFSVNATGTLHMLEATRRLAPEAVFIFTSTNKVYGDTPNRLPLQELEKRWEIEPEHPYADGIKEDMSIDMSLHSLFGASKVAADVLVQEYGRYFDLRSACFRAGCLTGPNHSGAELHGFLAYLVKCTATGLPYTIYGYKGKQVRDNLHSADLVAAIDHFFRNPRCGEVYNMGGGRHSNCSIQEVVEICETIAGRTLNRTYSESNRRGDHIWWISSLAKFCDHYPEWHPTFDVRMICQGIFDANIERWNQETTL